MSHFSIEGRNCPAVTVICGPAVAVICGLLRPRRPRFYPLRSARIVCKVRPSHPSRHGVLARRRSAVIDESAASSSSAACTKRGAEGALQALSSSPFAPNPAFSSCREAQDQSRVPRVMGWADFSVLDPFRVPRVWHRPSARTRYRGVQRSPFLLGVGRHPRLQALGRLKQPVKCVPTHPARR
jgi:hypothetical protein